METADTSSTVITYTVQIIIGVISLIVGSLILNKGIKWIKFIHIISGLSFFGNLTTIIGTIIFLNISGKLLMESHTYILYGCVVGIAIIGAIFCYFIPVVGNTALGAIAGWSFWSLFSSFIPIPLITLIVGIILSIISIFIVLYFKGKGQIIAAAWLGSYLSVYGAGNAIISICALTISPFNIPLVLIIISCLMIVASFILFGTFWYLQNKNYTLLQSDIEMQKELVKQNQ